MQKKPKIPQAVHFWFAERPHCSLTSLKHLHWLLQEDWKPSLSQPGFRPSECFIEIECETSGSLLLWKRTWNVTLQRQAEVDWKAGQEWEVLGRPREKCSKRSRRKLKYIPRQWVVEVIGHYLLVAITKNWISNIWNVIHKAMTFGLNIIHRCHLYSNDKEQLLASAFRLHNSFNHLPGRTRIHVALLQSRFGLDILRVIMAILVHHHTITAQVKALCWSQLIPYVYIKKRWICRHTQFN